MPSLFLHAYTHEGSEPSLWHKSSGAESDFLALQTELMESIALKTTKWRCGYPYSYYHIRMASGMNYTVAKNYIDLYNPCCCMISYADNPNFTKVANFVATLSATSTPPPSQPPSLPLK